MPYKSLVFDFFGVISSEVAPFWLARHFSPADASKVKATLVHAADLGSISQHEMFLSLSTMTRVPADQIEEEWILLAQIDNNMVTLLERLRPHYQLGLLTNSPAPFVRRLLDQNDLNRFFERVVVSSERRCAKPDLAIYERILTELDVQASEALMIDDNPVNIKGAARAGMGTILFHSHNQLESALRNWSAE